VRNKYAKRTRTKLKLGPSQIRRHGIVSLHKQPAVDVRKIKYEQMRDALLADYKMNGMRSLRVDKEGKPVLFSVKRMDTFFAGKKASQITPDEIRRFVLQLQSEEAANATINRSLAALKRMFKLAIKDGKLQVMPHIEMLQEAAPRKGFVTVEQFKRLRDALPDYLKPVLTLGYYTGMRLGEIKNLQWTNINFKDATIRLSGEETKNGEARTVPLNTETVLMLKMIKHDSASDLVFGKGKRLGDFRKAWAKACEKAELSGLIFHDLRRSAVRELVRAGVPEKVAMSISGHRTRAVFDRYNIVSESDLKAAVKMRDAYQQRQQDERQEEAAL
jgi:integrase